MPAMGTVKGKVIVLDDEVELPEGARVEITVAAPHEAPLPDHMIDPLDIEARIRAARARFAHLSPEERRARVEAAAGSMRDAPGSVDDFIRQKQEDIEWENRRWKDDEA